MQKSLLALESGVKILQAAYVGVAKAMGMVDKEVGENGELVEGIAQQVRILSGTLWKQGEVLEELNIDPTIKG